MMFRLAFIAAATVWTVTAYTPACRGCSGITASGAVPVVGRTVACPPRLAFGTRVHIDGIGERTCEDRGGAIKGRKLDLLVGSRSEALRFGRQRLAVVVR